MERSLGEIDMKLFYFFILTISVSCSSLPEYGNGCQVTEVVHMQRGKWTIYQCFDDLEDEPKIIIEDVVSTDQNDLF
jgi:hypothetical protein